jgi:hypothetical protein
MLALNPQARWMPLHFKGILDWLRHQLMKSYIPNSPNHTCPFHFFQFSFFMSAWVAGLPQLIVS